MTDDLTVVSRSQVATFDGMATTSDSGKSEGVSGKAIFVAIFVLDLVVLRERRDGCVELKHTHPSSFLIARDFLPPSSVLPSSACLFSSYHEIT